MLIKYKRILLNILYNIIGVVVFFVLCYINPGIIIFLLGMLIIYNAIKLILVFKRVKENGINIKGIIVSYESDDEGYKFPVAEFKTINGELIKGKPIIYLATDFSKIKSYKNEIKNSVEIVYNAKNPNEFLFRREQNYNFLFLIIFPFLGLLLIVVSMLSFLGYIKMY